MSGTEPNPNPSWSEARERFLRRKIDDTTQPRHIRGWLRHQERLVEMGRRRRMRNPPGYDVGHRRARVLGGTNEYDNLRFEFATMNRARGPRERMIARRRVMRRLMRLLRTLIPYL